MVPKAPAQGLHRGPQCHGTGVDDADQQFYENYVCGSERNYTGYCNAEADKLVDRQSMEPIGKAKKLVWESNESWSTTVRARSSFIREAEPAGSLRG